MNAPQSKTNATQSRRTFLERSGGALAGAALAGTLVVPRAVHAGEDNTIKIALVGCGGRGTGAAFNALSTSGPTKLWAMADVLPDRLESSFKELSNRFSPQVDVPPERRFLGLDAFAAAIDTLGASDVVILATPPAFRPRHFECAVNKGVNVFMEKSFAVDGPGVRRILAAGEVSVQKNLKVAGGLNWRHSLARDETIRRLHDGAIGELHTLRTYRMHGPVGFRPRSAGESELVHQIRNYSCFPWLNASFFVDWLIHSIDVCCWAKNAWPVAAQGQGGRQARTEPDQMWDHYAVEYKFADGARLFAQGRHMAGCWDIYGDEVHGSKGSAVIMESLARANPRIYSSQLQTPANEIWRYGQNEPDSYQLEHDLLFAAIRNDTPYNETERCGKAVLASILGRMAAHSGQMVTWDQALNSSLELAPGLDKLAWDGPAPVMPNAQGAYPISVPGVTREL